MQDKIDAHQTLMSKQKGQPVHIKTSEYSYWGRIYTYDGQTVILKLYYTNQEEDLQLHNSIKEFRLDEIIDVD
jgi:hypothetical protein